MKCEPVEEENEQESVERFNQRISDREACPTVGALPFQKNPAENRQVVVPLDGCATMWATGSRPDHRQAFRNAVDADIQERADDSPEDEDHQKQWEGLAKTENRHNNPFNGSEV